MKLYNIYESLILEGNMEKVNRAINDKVAVKLKYKEPNGDISDRYVFIYGLGKTKAGNSAIRVFQAFGQTKTDNSKWKTFLTDRIVDMTLTNFKFHKPVNNVSGGEGIPDYVGPSDLSMMNGELTHSVKFNNIKSKSDDEVINFNSKDNVNTDDDVSDEIEL